MDFLAGLVEAGPVRIEAVGSVEDFGEQVDVADGVQEYARRTQHPPHGGVNVGPVLQRLTDRLRRYRREVPSSNFG